MQVAVLCSKFGHACILIYNLDGTRRTELSLHAMQPPESQRHPLDSCFPVSLVTLPCNTLMAVLSSYVVFVGAPYDDTAPMHRILQQGLLLGSVTSSSMQPISVDPQNRLMCVVNQQVIVVW